MTVLMVVSLFLTPTYSQIGEIVSGVSTNVAISQIKNGLQDLINKSMDRADYSMAKAAIQALGAIDAWKQANIDLLETAFEELDEKSRNIFENSSVLINQANVVVANNLETTRQIVENANQITESIPGSGKRSFILRYYPSVISPLEKDSVLIRLKGVNLDIANIHATLPNGENQTIKIVGPTEGSFWLPISLLSFGKEKHQVFDIKINHVTRSGSRMLFWPKYENVERTLLFGTLPSQVGTFTLNATRSFNEEERMIHTQDMGRFEGRNTNVEKVATPPSGYLWDLRSGVSARSNFQIISTGSGEAGRCQEIIWNGSNEHGIIGRARCDEIRQIRNFSVRYDDGYKHCGIRGPIYRFIPTSEEITPKTGSIYWGKDQIIELPTDVSKFTLRIELYTGEEKVITNSYSDNTFEVKKENNRIILRTKIPTDIN
jgi:hypothetical protein